MVEATVCRVAFHRLNELRPRVVQVLHDDMQLVLLTASGHANVNVDACHARRIGQHRERTVDGRVLDAVGGRGIRPVRMLAHILGRERDRA